jgi:hypothetical protein
MESDDEGILAKILIPEGATGIEVCQYMIVFLGNESLSVFLLNLSDFYTSLFLGVPDPLVDLGNVFCLLSGMSGIVLSDQRI